MDVGDATFVNWVNGEHHCGVGCAPYARFTKREEAKCTRIKFNTSAPLSGCFSCTIRDIHTDVQMCELALRSVYENF